MPFLDSQDPSQHGWKQGAAATIVPLAWRGAMGINSFGGVTFPGGVASGTEGLWTALLNELAPQIDGGILQGECFGYENRANVNSPGQASFHAYGLAIDINAAHNPNGSAAGTGKYQIGPWANAIAAKYGMLWGGAFTGTKDPMHFEIHLSPDEVAAFPTSGLQTTPSGTAPNTGSGIARTSYEVAAAIGVLIIIAIIVMFSFT